MGTKSTQQCDAKRPYRKPTLKVYGTIEKLTATVSISGHSDSGTGSMFRTH